MKRILILAVVIAFAMCGTAWAEDACKADTEKFCKDIKPGGGRVIACLNSHQSELTDACKKRLAEGKEKAEIIVSECRADANSLCKEVKRGNGRVYSCLKSNKDKLSEGCKKVIDKM
jgi:phage host-nuclease inhibitor protein Gam